MHSGIKRRRSFEHRDVSEAECLVIAMNMTMQNLHSHAVGIGLSYLIPITKVVTEFALSSALSLESCGASRMFSAQCSPSAN